jgi:hypothetical protein
MMREENKQSSKGIFIRGQLGHSGTEKKNIPDMIPNLVDIVQIFVAGNSSIVKNFCVWKQCFLP